MSNTNTGGPAFPTENARQTGPSSWHYEGMTLRDYFAAKAMNGLMGRNWSHLEGVSDMELLSIWAESSYAMADAMLKARDQS